MKLQNMTVIFSIIIIPITLILSAYIGIQIDTAAVQQQYDTKLMDATHDAIVAFELNTINNQYSTNADSIRRDIKAAVNTFCSSLATGLGMSGSSAGNIMPYLPALVFTLYDGYYIYSPNEYNYEDNGVTKTGYEHILKPYIHYSARYKSGNTDIVINYSLDNYISVYGNIAGIGYVSKSGYLINPEKVVKNGDTVIGYRLTSTFTLDTTQIETVIEKDENGNEIRKQSSSMKKYYQEAYEFTDWVLNIARLPNVVKPENALKGNGDKYIEFQNNGANVLAISSTNDPEDKSSAFYQHKLEVMKLSIQENLNIAIAIYDKHSTSMGTNVDFKLPILSDNDWDKLLTNVNMISFMQGIPAGSKLYNNYAIVTSTQNKQFVNANSLYFTDGSDHYHRIQCPEMNKNNTIIGYKSMDFRKFQTSTDKTKYYYKHSEYACYRCMVNSLDDDMVQKDLNHHQLQGYYSALARERYDLDKVTKMLEQNR